MEDYQNYASPETFRSIAVLLPQFSSQDLKSQALTFENLKTDGSSQPVDKSNVNHYVQLYISNVLIKERIKQMAAFQTGLFSIPALRNILQVLSPSDLQLLISGDTVLTPAKVLSSLRFRNFPEKSETPRHLQEIIRSYDEKSLARFLQFCTGSPRLGYCTQQIQVFCVKLPSTGARPLPISHACFYQLDLPDYGNPVVLAHKLSQALQTGSSSFTLA